MRIRPILQKYKTRLPYRAFCRIINAAGRFCRWYALPGSTKAGEVMHMDAYQVLMIMLTIIGLLLKVYELCNKRGK